MDGKIPVICPVLHYNNSIGYYSCEQTEEYEVLRKAGWSAGFCNGVYIEHPYYLKCPGFSHWFWKEVTHQMGQKVSK